MKGEEGRGGRNGGSEPLEHQIFQMKSNFIFCKKNTLYMSNQNKKVLLRGGHMAHNVPSSCDHKKSLYKVQIHIYL